MQCSHQRQIDRLYEGIKSYILVDGASYVTETDKEPTITIQ